MLPDPHTVKKAGHNSFSYISFESLKTLKKWTVLLKQLTLVAKLSILDVCGVLDGTQFMQETF